MPYNHPRGKTSPKTPLTPEPRSNWAGLNLLELQLWKDNDIWSLVKFPNPLASKRITPGHGVERALILDGAVLKTSFLAGNYKGKGQG